MKYKTISIILLICLILTVFGSFTFLNRSYFKIEVENQQNSNEITKKIPRLRKIFSNGIDLVTPESNYVNDYANPMSGFYPATYKKPNQKITGIAEHTPRTPILINGDASFTGANGVINGTGTEQDPYLIANWSITSNQYNLIQIVNTNAYFVIQDCHLDGIDGSYQGIYLQNVQNGKVDNNAILSCHYGIYLVHPNENNNFSSNTIYKCWFGIYLKSSNSTIFNNTIHDCQKGIYLTSNDNLTVSSNEVYGNSDHGISAYTTTNSTFSNNVIYNNSNSGLVVITTNNTILSHNIIYNNSFDGISLPSSNNINVSSNNIYNNYMFGIRLWASTDNIIVSWNKFINNQRGGAQATDDGTANSFMYNFWDNWSTPDNNYDGIVDTPCYILGGRYDFLPLSYPYTTPRGPIYIDDNADFITLGFPGSGTIGEPYVISENFITNKTTEIISIRNTTVYFIIINNLFIGIDGSRNGISLRNVTYGTIISNSIYSTQDGIYLNDYCKNISIASNIIYNSSGCGIRLENSSFNTISHNTIYNNTNTGIHLYLSCHNNTVFNNSISYSDDGFSLESSNNNTLTNNTATNNSARGFNLDSSNKNTLTSNTATNNSWDGFRLVSSSNNILTSNTARNNYWDGFDLSTSSNNTLTSNLANNNTFYGFHLWTSSDNNSLTSNTATKNSATGFFLWTSSNNTWSSNNATKNSNIGFALESSSNNTLTSNTATNNSWEGFGLYATSNNTLTSNVAINNYYNGFYLFSSSNHNTLTSNVAINNSNDGFYIRKTCDYNTLTSNIASNNSQHGFYVYDSSDHNTLSSNNATNNSRSGFRFYQASNNTISGNTGNNNDYYGIHLIGTNSDYNEIYLNSFIDNTMRAGQDDSSTSTNVFTNGTHGNYWSDYTGVDFNKNGIGDTPYLIGGGAGTEDLYPLMMTSIISGPSDFGIFYGDTGYSLLWTVTDSYPANLLWTITDSYPANYTVYRNGIIYGADTWTDSVFIWLIALEEGSHNFTCLVENTFGKMTSDEVWVTVLPVTPDLTPPSISSSGNLTFEEGSIGYSITWTGSDDRSPWWASVRRDTTLIYDQPWIGNDIQINLDGLLNGYYIYNCTFFDEAGNSIFDIVTVNVTEPFPDTISPYIISPDPLEFEEKTTGHILTWICSDDHPYAYTIRINDTDEIFSPWRGENITYFVDDLPVGIWEVNLTLYDLSGNSVTGAVIVTVNPEAPDITAPTVSHPADIIIAENTVCTLVWEVDDKYPNRYTIARNGTVIFEHSYWVQGIIQYHLTSLPLGVWEFNLTAWDEAGNSASAIVVVKVLLGSAIDTSSPSISHVPDIEIIYGTTNSTFVVYLFDDHPAGYLTAISTETNITEHVWTSPNVKVEFCLDGLAIGSYTVVIVAWDTFGNEATRNVKVTVTGDISPPTISHLSDITAYENMSIKLIWEVSEVNPSYYELITLPEEVIIQTEPWSDNSIEIIISNLPTGTYQYRFIVYDIGGNFAVDDFTITVIKPRETPGFEIFSVVLCTLLITKLVPYLRCKRRKKR